MMLCLDGYSDDSDTDSEPEQIAAQKNPAPVEPVVASSEDEGHESPTAKPAAEPETPNASTCEPQSDYCQIESDDSEKEQESDAEGSLGKDANCFSIQGLLRLRHGVSAMDILRMTSPEWPEYDLTAMEVASQQSDNVADEPKHERPARHKAGRNSKVQQKKPSSSWPGSEKVEKVRAKELQVSDDSWLAKQQAHRRTTQDCSGDDSLSDEVVVRSMKSILNKLTVEKFSPLCDKLVSCGIKTTFHLETLITEVFEKATTQHHFISMYADLCVVLHTHFIKNPITDDPKTSFKKILLNGCQAFFEKHLKAPANLEELDEEDRVALQRKYKMQMLGNIRFVGALLVRQMLASKVLFAICEELLSEPTPESLESLAALLTVVGPKFDIPEWASHQTLALIFDQVQMLAKQAKLNCRVRCLLKDVLELRASRWQDKKPKKTEGPSTLKEVADTQAAEEASGATSKSPKNPNRQYQAKPSPSYGADYNVRKNPSSSPSYGGKRQTWSPTTPSEGYQRISSLAALMQGKAPSQKKEEERTNSSVTPFDKESCRKEVLAAVGELRMSHEVKEAILRICALSVPHSNQQEMLCDMLGQMVEEGSSADRKVCFELLAGLFTEGHWKPHALCKGLKDFIEDVAPELKCDIPTLPTILREELHLVFAPLVSKGVLETSLHEALGVAC